jgi:signal transduction histidine kinase
MRGRWILAAAALVLGVASAALRVTGAGPGDSVEVVLGLLVGWSFVGAGLIASAQRPGNRIGPLMVGVGFIWFLNWLAWAEDPAVAVAGYALAGAYLGGFAHLLLAFPSGRLGTGLSRAVVAGAYADAIAVQALIAAAQFNGRDRLAAEIADVQLAAAVVLATLLVGELARRWRAMTPAARRAGAPVLWAGAAAVVLLIVTLVDDRFELGLDPGVWWVFLAVLAAVPLSFLAGLLRERLARAGVAELVVELGRGVAPGALRDALARSLGDPTLTLAYWVPERQQYVDLDGNPVVVAAANGRAATLVEREGRRIGALIHDASLRNDRALVDGVGAAAALALDNERLQAELRAHLGELAKSRARLVEAADAERRRIERNLHDGVQQRLVSVSMALGLASARANDPPASRTVLDEAREGLSVALEELRALSHGIHPGVLTERGLAVAVSELAWTASLPVTVAAELDGRLDEAVESAAYYVVAEALANVAKHAQATSAHVSIAHEEGCLVVTVADDGVGGADPSRGSGLAGLADRVAVLGGSLRLDSPAGAGTSLRAEIPCG